jgi:hypothetical protein
MAGWEQAQWLEEYRQYIERQNVDTSNVYPEGGGDHWLKKEHLKKEDGTYAALQLKISKAEAGEVDGNAQMVLHFEGKERVLGCNKTNWQVLTSMYGTESDNWLGQTIKIYVDPNVEYPKGNKVGGIRIQYEAPESDDDIPF